MTTKSSVFLLFLKSQMAPTVFGGGGSLNKNAMLHIYLSDEVTVWFLFGTVRKSGGACLDVLIPEKTLLILQTFNAVDS